MAQVHFRWLKNVYTFFSHLKWTWAIALGYAASIGCHMLLAGML